MTDLRSLVIPGLWLFWALYWFIAAQSAKPVERRESAASRAAHVVPLAIAAWLLISPRLPKVLAYHWLVATSAWQLVGSVAVLSGIAIAVWARRVLGRNWSGSVTVKQEHELIVAGPYRIVRHPIYTGLLLALAGTALARGNVAGVLAFVIATAALWRKLRLEEQWMRETFGAGYANYAAVVPALVPFVRRRQVAE